MTLVIGVYAPAYLVFIGNYNNLKMYSSAEVSVLMILII